MLPSLESLREGTFLQMLHNFTSFSSRFRYLIELQMLDADNFEKLSEFDHL